MGESFFATFECEPIQRPRFRTPRGRPSLSSTIWRASTNTAGGNGHYEETRHPSALTPIGNRPRNPVNLKLPMKPRSRVAQVLRDRITDNPGSSATTTNARANEQHHDDQQIDRHQDRFTTTAIKAKSMLVLSISKDHLHLGITIGSSKTPL